VTRAVHIGKLQKAIIHCSLS